jgi:hypothetical protein
MTGFPYFLATINLPQRFQIVNRDSPVMAGIHLLPLLGAVAFGSGLGGIVSSRRNNTFWTLLVASSLVLISCGLMSNLSADFKISGSIDGYQVILGLGVGLTFSSITVMTVLEAELDDRGKLYYP